MLIVILIAFYEQSKSDGNKYIMIACFVIFMYGMMRLSAKTKSKNEEKNEQEI